MNKIIYFILVFIISISCLNYNCLGQNDKPYTKEWEELTKVEVCFVGGENYIGKDDIINIDARKITSENGAFGQKKWLSFLKSNKDEIVPFLISQISDIRRSKMHVCPYDNALNGEIAIYCLEHIFKTNWYELDEYKQRFTNGVTWDEVGIARMDKDYNKLKEYRTKYKYRSYQSELQKIVKNQEEARKMKEVWSNIYENEKISSIQ